MTTPKRFQVCSWNDIYNLPPDTIYVGRSPDGRITHAYPFGNPAKIGRDGAREAVLALYRKYLDANPDLVDRIKRELRGKNVACWCRLDEACHADIILEIANA